MTARRLGALLLVPLLVCPMVSGQETAAPQRDPQAVAALSGALAALGGAAQPAPTSIVASGTYTRFLTDSSVTSALRVEVLGFDNYRWELDTSDLGTVTTIVSGLTGSRQYGQQSEAVSVGQLPGCTHETFPALALAQWVASSSIGAKFVGLESIAGKSVQHISIQPAPPANLDPNLAQIFTSAHQREIYLDAQTLLPVRLRYYAHPVDWRVGVAIDLEYSNFQVVSGIAFPQTITSYLRGTKLTQTQFQSLTLNAPVSASDFVKGQP